LRTRLCSGSFLDLTVKHTISASEEEMYLFDGYGMVGQISASIVGAHVGDTGLPTEEGFVVAFVVSAGALALAFRRRAAHRRRQREPVVPHGYERLGEPARVGAR
jgi:hypothetical protein